MASKVLPLDSDEASPQYDRKGLKDDIYNPKSIEHKPRRYCLIFIILLIICVLLILVTLLLLFGIASCIFKSCHPNASCINYSFGAKCKCNRGFNGNGLECDECGLSYPNNSLAIEPAYYSRYNDRAIPAPFSYPASVYIDVRYRGIVNVTSWSIFEDFDFKCEGILINRRTILTSANCFIRKYSSMAVIDGRYIDFDIQVDSLQPDYSYSAYVGLFRYFYLMTDVSPARQVHIESIKLHEEFDNSSLNNNIAIVRLKESVELDKFVQLACIPDSSDLEMQGNYLNFNRSAVSIGWGFYSINDDSSYYLTDFELNILKSSNCSGFYTKKTDQREIICAVNYNQLEQNVFFQIGFNCQGALGSALYVNTTVNGTTKTLAVGININNTLCGFGVYSNLFYFADWIERNSQY